MIIDAILKINPNAKVVVRGDNLNTCTLEWLENTTPISKADIEAQIPILEKEIKDAAAKKATDKAVIVIALDHSAVPTISFEAMTFAKKVLYIKVIISVV